MAVVNSAGIESLLANRLRLRARSQHNELANLANDVKDETLANRQDASNPESTFSQVRGVARRMLSESTYYDVISCWPI